MTGGSGFDATLSGVGSGGMGENCLAGGGGGMGGAVPAGTREPGQTASSSPGTGTGGVGGGSANGTAGTGDTASGNAGGSAGDGGGGGGGDFNTRGGGGFGGGGGTGLSSGFGGGIGAGGGAGMGGAIFNHAGSLTLINATLTANSATGGYSFGGGDGGSGYGGAIFNLNGNLHISFSTLAFNTVIAGTASNIFADGNADGGEIYTLGYNGNSSTGSVNANIGLSNTIVANSSGGMDLIIDAPANVAGGLVNVAAAAVLERGADGLFGFNLVMTSASLTNAGAQPARTLTADPLLDVLALNHASNAPFTRALKPGSPATRAADCLDFNENFLVPVDERGSLRPATGCDLGAYDGERIFANGFQ